MCRPRSFHCETGFIYEHELAPRVIPLSRLDFHHGEEQGDAGSPGRPGPDRYGFFCVHDGHAGAARWFDHMLELLSEEMKARRVVEVDVGGREEHWREAMEACFERMDEEVVRGRGRVEELKAVVLVVGDEEIVVASRGDSTAVLYRGHVALGLSSHPRFKLHGPNEKSSSKPSVRITDRRDEDRFVLIASNCLWDVLSEEVACRIVGRCLDGEWAKEHGEDARGSLGATKAATVLAGLAMARGSKDNISVLVVQLANSVH
ncbi:hypothetical protein MLD38_036314 [Melastoma candidum]|uniref:Uncharacterized protein n=1 Tax=Melastoma candidum TaxID=119954 RepID=A0ACB9LJJ7_9MYRT|nr:hypothetical protein MLD38_036314 [Melastoma candidum]